MAYPSGVELCTVTAGSSIDFFGNPQPISVEVTAVLGGTAVRLIWEATGQPFVASMGAYKAEPGAGISFEVPNPTQGGFINGSGNPVRNWSYVATVISGAQRWVQAFQPLDGQSEIDLDLIPDGQVTQPTSAPAPLVTSVNGKVGAVIISATGGGAVLWDDVLEKPGTFTPATHTHTVAETTGLQTVLDGKQPSGSYATTEDLATGLSGKQDTGNYVDSADARLSDARAPLAHGHGITDVVGLNTALAAAGEPTVWSDIPGKPASFPPAVHSHAVGAITGLQDELDGKQPAGSYATPDELSTGLATKSDAVHTHTISDTAGLQDALDAASGGGGSPAWENITGKPVAFPPSAHFHTVDDVTGLQTMLDGKQPAGSYATTEQLTAGLAGKQPTGAYATTADLAGKQDAGDYVEATDTRLSDARTPTAHEHAVGDVTGLQSALDAKQASGSYATASELTNGLASKQNIGDYIEEGDARLDDSRTPTAHSHTWAEVTDKPTTFAPATHSHTVSDTTGLQAALDGKQVAGIYATSSDLTTGLAGKANTSHTHTIANTTGLQTALDAKGTSNLALGTTSTTAKAGNYTPPIADLPTGITLTIYHNGTTWPTRPTTRTDITIQWVGGATAPPTGAGGAINGVDIWISKVAP